MDPQLTKQLNKRRLILENSLDDSIKNENTVEKIDTTSKLITDVTPPNYNIKHNFREKIKKFESFGDNQVNKSTQRNTVDKSRSNAELVNKFKIFNSDAVSKKTLVTSKLELNTTKDTSADDNKRSRDNGNEKIKPVEPFPVLENNQITVKDCRTSNLRGDERPQTSSERCTKTLKTKSCSKSDYNNWELDKKWMFFTEYPSLMNSKVSLFASKILKKKKKSATGIVQSAATVFAKNQT